MEGLRPMRGVFAQEGADPQTVATRLKPSDGRRPDAVARGMESMFLSSLLKEMRQTLEPGGLFAGDQGDVLGGLFDQYLGDHLAQSGGLGIAALMQQPRTRPQPTWITHGTPPV